MIVAKVARTHQFDRDLVAIWGSLAAHNEEAAERIVARIEAKISTLAQFPELGEATPQYGQHTRRLVEGPYVILYDAAPEHVLLLRAYHAARDI